ncbi:MAG: hypothetical protein ACE5ID_06065, partial [Acidobacteriota bacterium]
FDPHTRSTLPPPDVDFFYFTGGEGDHATIDLKTDDQGLTFDSMIELFALPISLSVTDPSSAVAVQPVSASQLEFLSSSDDKSAADLDPRLDFILPRTGIYVVKVTASPKATLPGVEVFYSIELHSLRPDEVSVPVIIRGGYIGIITGLKFQIQFDSTKVKVTGVDDIQGLRLSNAPTSGKPSIPSAQEIVVQPVPGSPGHVDVAIRSFDGNGPIKPPEFCPVLDPMCSDNMGTRNGVSGFSLTRELLLARIRFRAVGPGTTRVVFVPNPTTQGATLLNVAEKQPGNRVFIPANGFGPGVTITVTP